MSEASASPPAAPRFAHRSPRASIEARITLLGGRDRRVAAYCHDRKRLASRGGRRFGDLYAARAPFRWYAAVPERWLQARVRTPSGARDAGAIRCSSSRSSSSRPPSSRDRPRPAHPPRRPALVPDSLRDKAKAHPKDAFHVVIQTSDASELDGLGATVREAQKKHPGKCEGPEEEVQADRQRDGGGHRRPDRRHRRGERASSA